MKFSPPHPARFGLLVLLMLLAAIGSAAAQAQNGPLKVTDAFRLTATIQQPGRITLHWTIADDYYLYRGRVKVTSATEGVTLGKPELPPGKKEHDPYLGNVETWRGEVTATVPYQVQQAGLRTLALKVGFQGCHEVDPKICYPPHAQTVELTLPAATAASVAPQGPKAAAIGQAATAFLGKPLGGDDPLPPDQAFRFSATAATQASLRLTWQMPKGYYLYRDQTRLTLVDAGKASLGVPAWPAGTQHADAFFGKTTVYFDQVQVAVPIRGTVAPGSTLHLEARYQGCQENGICYPPITRKVAIVMPAAVAGGDSRDGNGNPASSGPAAESTGQSAVDMLAGSLTGSGRWLALLSFFGAGLLLAFTPCVLPMVPILSGLIAGTGKPVSSARACWLSIVYVLACAVIFTLAGIVAGMVGANLQAAFQTPWVLWLFALLFVLLALSMFGLYELKLPSRLQNWLTHTSNNQQSGSVTGVAVMGALSAFIVGPCVTPPLAAAILYIAERHDPVFGGLALFSLALGMGVPLIIFGTTAGRLLPRSGPWMSRVQALFGVLFLGLAVWMLSRILDPLWIMLMTGLLLIGCGVYLGAGTHLHDKATGWRKLGKAAGLAMLVLGATELVGVATGSGNVLTPLSGFAARGVAEQSSRPAFRIVKSVDALQQALAAARQQGKPVMLDFYADWCVSCKEMEQFTYSDPQVEAAMRQFVLLKADVTANNTDDKALLKHFGLYGPPATLYFDADTGKELRSLRLVGFESATPFLARLDRARES